MKKLIAILIVSAFMLSGMGFMSSVSAADPLKLIVITNDPIDGTPVSGINVQIFQISTAIVNANALDKADKIKYTPTSDFANALNGVQLNTDIFKEPNPTLSKILNNYASMSAEENNAIAGILNNYAAVHDNIIETGKNLTDDNGTVVFDNPNAGLYLVTQKVDASSNSGNNIKYEMQSLFIVSVPCIDDIDITKLNYAVTAYPKLVEVGKVTVNKYFSSQSDMPTDSTIHFTVRLTSTMNSNTYIDFILDSRHQWTSSRGDIPVGTYNVSETGMPSGYGLVSMTATPQMSGNQITVKSDAAVTINVTNKKTPYIPPTTPGPTPPPDSDETTTTTAATETTTEKPNTTTTESTTEPTGGTTGTTTTTGSEETTTAKNTVFSSESSPLGSLPSIPTYATTGDLIQLPNGWFAEDLGDGLYAIFDNDGVPLGYVQLGDGDDIMTYDVEHNLVPLDSQTTTEVPKSNPKTGDSIYLTGFIFLAGLLGGVLLLNKRYQWIK
ncbi:MAG: hypothetical protein FWD71_04300 [Oscillospiraceae bacterium]|nr:hypothetical protein [Oscillospiraceae bacterium]